MKKTTLLSLVLFASLHMAAAQTLEKMTWFNEPEQWEISGNTLSLFVTPQSDYWRISHYGFTVDDAPFYYATYGGEFEAKIRISGEYRERFDQAGLMLRIDHENYIKAGIEFVDGKYNLAVEQINGSCFAQRASSVGNDVLCPESAASLASGGWFGVRPSGADRAGQPRRARWFDVAAKKPMRDFCATRTQPRSFRFSDPGVGSTFDV